MRINVYTAFNGVGLQKDYEIIKSLLSPKHEVVGVDWLKREMGKPADINIHMEIPRYECLSTARRNILIPNPEWFAKAWVTRILCFNEVWCKTSDCHRIFSKLNPRSVLTGFMSDDLFMPTVYKEKKMIHVAGKSHTKGTLEIIEAYKKYPDLPPCTIISSEKWEVSGNLTLMGRVPCDELKMLLNENLIHLCPSSYEGWGHYLHESFSTGAIVITTDFPPMNEFTKRNLVQVSSTTPMHQAIIGHVSVDKLAEEIMNVNRIPEDELKEIGMKNREGFLQRNLSFKNFILKRIP